MKTFSFKRSLASAALMVSISVSGLASAQDLRSALQELVGTSPAIKAAQESITQAQQSLAATEQRLYPSVVLDLQLANVNRYNNTVRGVSKTSGVTKTVKTGGITAKQGLFSGYSDIARIEEAEAALKRANALYQDAVQTELEQAVTAYFTVLQELGVLESLNETLVLSVELHDQVRKNTENGAGAGSELIRAEKDIVDVEAKIAAQGRRVAKAIGNYVRYFGKQPEPETMQFEELTSNSLPVSLDVLIDNIQMHPRVVAGFLRTEAMLAKVKGAESARYPTLDLTLSHEQDNDSYVANKARDGINLSSTLETRLELNLRWDITDAFLNGNAEDSARARVRSERAKAQAFAKRIEGQAVQTWDDYQYYLSELDALESMLDQEDKLVDLEERNASSGGGNKNSLLKQMLRRERAIQRHIRALAGLEIAKAKLLSLTNGLSAEL